MKTKTLPESITARTDLADLIVIEIERRPYGTYEWRSAIKAGRRIIWESEGFGTKDAAASHSVEIVDELNEAEKA